MDNRRDDPHDRTRWPAWATETVTIAPSDLAYPRLARAYHTELADLLADTPAGPVEHVGSTAVPGLEAKPVVDLSVTLPDPSAWCAAHAGALAARGWHLVPPELDGRPRRLLVRVDAAERHRLAHLHLWWTGSRRHREMIAFRDALRADPALAAGYAALKHAAAVAHRDDREAYTASKEAFVARVLRGDPATG